MSAFVACATRWWCSSTWLSSRRSITLLDHHLRLYRKLLTSLDLYSSSTGYILTALVSLTSLTLTYYAELLIFLYKDCRCVHRELTSFNELGDSLAG
jgi:hypothetical protein